jgi:predicted PurR-regulated permease PerM
VREAHPTKTFVPFVIFVVKNPFLLGVLCAFAGDIPSFGCGFAALGSLWLIAPDYFSPTF